MIKSMTGYGRYETVEAGKKISVEIKSVNHRYSDYIIKVPKYFGFLEDRIREYASKFIFRGKVDILVNIESYGDADKEIILNEELAKSYIEALHKLRDDFNLADDISVSAVARYADIFKTERKDEDQDALWKSVEKVLKEAILMFISMREREGERIKLDLIGRVEYMKAIAQMIDERSPETVKEYQSRLYAKIKELLDDRQFDENRILTEVAIFADKVAVNEEIVRLSSHFDEFYNILNSNEPSGRKLDFLIQEINREVNTIGSKANDIEIAKKVVELKAELEKLREQVQNIE
ncbi:MAG: YicC family protein [Clostridia bacterium]|nr:YicC family protein [Clostridia bacterium]